MSGVGCGCDASLYLVKMKDADRFGPNYCDIQGVGGSAPCAEIDLFEGNRQAIASTVHMTQGTGADGTCNQDGCTEKWGEHETNTRGELVSELYGPGGNIDTTLPFQVAATFYPDGTVTIDLSQTDYIKDKEVRVRFYDSERTGNRGGIDSPVSPEDRARTAAALGDGMVLVSSLWASEDLSWLDGGCEPKCKLDETGFTIADLAVAPIPPPPSPPPPPSSPPPSPLPSPAAAHAAAAAAAASAGRRRA